MTKLLKKVFLAVFAGVFIIGGGYLYLQTDPTLSNYRLCELLHGYLKLAWQLGLVIVGMFSIYAKVRPFALTVALLYGAYVWCDRPLDKTVWIKNFSDQNRSITINDKNYTFSPGMEKPFRFLTGTVSIDKKQLKERGTYVVNLAYPEKYLLYGPIHNIARHGTLYEASPLKLSKQKITKIDPEPDATISSVASVPLSPRCYYIEAVDAFNANYSDVAQIYKKGCDQNDSAFCFSFALSYEIGKGVPQSYIKAIALYKTACERGYAEACHNLAVNYNHGAGVAQDRKRAVALYKRACQGGVAESCFNIGNAYGYGLGVDVNMTMAAAYYRQACELGDGDGCYKTGRLYAYGNGVDKNSTLAKRYLKKACIAGNLKACSPDKKREKSDEPISEELKDEILKQIRNSKDPGTSFWQRAHYYMDE